MGSVVDIFLPLALAFMMVTVGLGLTVSDFARVVTRPKDVLTGLVLQIIVLPAVAFGLISVWPLSPEIAIGVLLIAIAPGGVTSNYLTALARGDVALSVSLTAVTSVLSVLTVPAILTFGYNFVFGDSLDQDISFARTAVGIFLIVTVPVLLGMAGRRFATHAANRIEPMAHNVSTVLFAVVLIGAIVQQRDNVVAYFADVGLVTLSLNVVMMALAFCVAMLLRTGLRQRISICLECGLQNGTLAIAVGVMAFGGGAYVIPAATYSLIMFATSLIFIGVSRRITADLS